MPDMERATDRVDRASATAASEPWWRSAVIYQVYIRSFADGNGDGVGDIAGLRSRLTYLADLGVDAIWINPWYPSPMADAGYDVSDYRDIEPEYGALAEAEALLRQAHALGLRVLLDLVPNHTSVRHPWSAFGKCDGDLVGEFQGQDHARGWLPRVMLRPESSLSATVVVVDKTGNGPWRASRGGW